MKTQFTKLVSKTDDCGTVELCLTVPRTALKEIPLIKSQLEKGKKMECELKEFKKARSIDANAYFHLLIEKLSKALIIGADELKIKLNLDYGTIDCENGVPIGFKLLESISPNRVCKYAKLVGKKTENSKVFNCYYVYKETHTLDSKEMANLIKGVVAECEQVGIETKTPNEIAEMLSLWESKNAKTNKNV